MIMSKGKTKKPQK